MYHSALDLNGRTTGVMSSDPNSDYVREVALAPIILVDEVSICSAATLIALELHCAMQGTFGGLHAIPTCEVSQLGSGGYARYPGTLARRQTGQDRP